MRRQSLGHLGNDASNLWSKTQIFLVLLLLQLVAGTGLHGYMKTLSNPANARPRS